MAKTKLEILNQQRDNILKQKAKAQVMYDKHNQQHTDQHGKKNAAFDAKIAKIDAKIAALPPA